MSKPELLRLVGQLQADKVELRYEIEDLKAKNKPKPSKNEPPQPPIYSTEQKEKLNFPCCCPIARVDFKEDLQHLKYDEDSESTYKGLKWLYLVFLIRFLAYFVNDVSLITFCIHYKSSSELWASIIMAIFTNLIFAIPMSFAGFKTAYNGAMKSNSRLYFACFFLQFVFMIYDGLMVAGINNCGVMTLLSIQKSDRDKSLMIMCYVVISLGSLAILCTIIALLPLVVARQKLTGKWQAKQEKKARREAEREKQKAELAAIEHEEKEKQNLLKAEESETATPTPTESPTVKEVKKADDPKPPAPAKPTETPPAPISVDDKAGEDLVDEFLEKV
eukprot:gnl/Carplike_NY0171/5430_a7425_271.p1 GENE.gnl/Carplike_NY0171/5430_a7425_271~~gnl/Carplike_NY0171/5430_a7425_271.p1  ORF type:complete len:357 (+),score=92.84 gnl/Carplike_NY0171/5430_a7425_271:73-1071(+)